MGLWGAPGCLWGFTGWEGCSAFTCAMGVRWFVRGVGSSAPLVVLAMSRFRTLITSYFTSGRRRPTRRPVPIGHCICKLGNVYSLFNYTRSATRRLGSGIVARTVSRGNEGVVISISLTLRLFRRGGGTWVLLTLFVSFVPGMDAGFLSPPISCVGVQDAYPFADRVLSGPGAVYPSPSNSATPVPCARQKVALFSCAELLLIFFLLSVRGHKSSGSWLAYSPFFDRVRVCDVSSLVGVLSRYERVSCPLRPE